MQKYTSTPPYVFMVWYFKHNFAFTFSATLTTVTHHTVPLIATIFCAYACQLQLHPLLLPPCNWYTYDQNRKQLHQLLGVFITIYYDTHHIQNDRIWGEKKALFFYVKVSIFTSKSKILRCCTNNPFWLEGREANWVAMTVWCEECRHCFTAMPSITSTTIFYPISV
jgi:hypothetical protein